MHDREIVLIAALAGLIWLTLACARAAGRTDHDTRCLADTATRRPPRDDIAMWELELQPQRPVYDWEVEGL